jgi:Uncharacterized protein conserved in bacteria
MNSNLRKLAQAISVRAVRTRFGQGLLRLGIDATRHRVFGSRTAGMMDFDLARLEARAKYPLGGAKIAAPQDRLHFGCGARRLSGWLNVDVRDSDYDVDLASNLPWRDAQFAAIVAQQVIEHLEFESELLPLLRELRRVSKSRAEIWLSCPDLERVCRSYGEDKGQGLVDDWAMRYGTKTPVRGIPSQHMINYFFHQEGEHRNLLDAELLTWALMKSGFVECQRVNEEQLLDRFPEIPPRRDDFCSVYVKASADR